MKKTALFLAVMLLLSMVVFASCKPSTPSEDPACQHVDRNADLVCDLCQAAVDAFPQPEVPDIGDPDWNNGSGSVEHVHNFVDYVCSCGATSCTHADENNDHICDTCKKVLSQCADEDQNHLCDVCNQKSSDCEDSDGDYACDYCGGECLPANLERVNYSLNISSLETGTLTADCINGKFNIVSGSEIRNRTKTYEGVEYQKSVKIGNSATKIKVDVPGAGKLSFLIQNGSSGATTQFVTVTAPDGTVHDIEFDGTNNGSPVVKIELDVTEGEWVISRGKNGGTQDIFLLSLSCIVEKADENGFELVSDGKVDYLVSDALDFSGIRLNATFANGKTDPLALDSVTIDSSAVNTAVSGTYPVVISYKEYAPITINVNYYAPESIELGFDAVEKLPQNTAAGNGVYYNHSFKELYLVGEEFNNAGLSVFVNGKCGDATKKFTVSLYTVSGFDSSLENVCTLTISAYGVETNVDIHVTAATPTPNEDDVYQLLVDPNYLGIAGTLSGPYHVFSTIQGALDYAAKIDKAAVKELSIAPGLYKEKLEIEIPNLHIIGLGENPDQVVIEWDSLYGLVDAGGFTHTTDSTQTVAIRESATNVTIENVTISNYWNSQDRMDAAGLGIERGLALLVQADRFVMKNSKLLGIQDTLELFTGRQYFENVFISGYTDFIFGTNNTTYFKNCTIHVIDTEKDDKGTAGYLTAFKGSNKGANDAIVYGAIFDQCKFTADEGVTAGCTAIGRTWGAYAAVAVINSELGGHISVKGYDSSNNKNTRYISMNGIHPTDSTVQFVEYNNTGAGAITEAVAGMRFLTAEEAALYADFATIFGTINGGVSYLDPWNPASTEIVVDDRDYYYFNGSSSSSGTSHTFDTTTTIAKGSTLEWDGLLISAENGNVAWNSNANSLNMKAGAFIKFSVKAGTSVTVETYPNYNYFTLNGVATASANMLTQYYAEDTEVTILSTGDLYIYSIIINPNEEAPVAPTLSEIKASGMNTNYVLGDEISLEGLEVKAIYSDNSIRFVTDYTVDSSAVVNTAEGEYEVVISYAGMTAIITVTYEDPNAGPEISKSTVLDFSTPDGLAAVQNNPKVTIEGSVRHNGGEIQIQGTISFQVKAGTVVTVVPYANTQYASYTIGKEGEEGLVVYNEMMGTMFLEDCTVVYTGLDNNYLVQIIIECPLEEGKYVFGGSSEEGDVTGILESIPGMTISGTCNTHSGGAQLGADSQIVFIAPSLSTVTIKGFDTNYGQLTVYADGEPVEMNANAQYVINVTEATTIVIEAKNVGTEEAPAYDKSYITYIDISVPEFIEESTEITFGSAGNYKDSVIDFSGITIGDNGGNNSQIKNGSFSFAVKNGAKVTVHGYSGYTSYNFGDGDIVIEGITDEYFNYEVSADCVITISHTTGNNYFYSISIVYPVVYDENTTIDLSATGANIQGATGIYEGLNIDATNGKFADNNGGWTQVNAGTVITLNVADGAQVSVTAYSSADNFTVAIADGVCTITCEANDYLKAITIAFGAEEPGGEAGGETKEEVTYVLDTTKDLAEMEKGTKADGDTQVVADFFTIHYSANTKIDSSGKKFDDGYEASQRINFGGTTKIGSTTKNCVEFTVTDDAVVTIWWVANKNDRQTVIFNANGEVVNTTTTAVQNALYIDSFELGAGTYYIGTSEGGSNYIFKVEVETTK